MARPAVLLMCPRRSDCTPKRIKRTKTKFSAAKPACLPVLFGASIPVLLDARNCIEDGPGRLGIVQRLFTGDRDTRRGRMCRAWRYRPGTSRRGRDLRK